MAAEIKQMNPVVKKEETKKEVKPEFNPAKKYTWSKDAEFVLSGSEFGLILNALRSVVGTQEAQALFIANEAVGALEEVLGGAVESGLVKEIEENKASL
jgi:hypothetical protein